MSGRRTSAPVVDPWTDDAPAIAGQRDFRVIDQGDQYVLELRDVPIVFEVRQVRHERGDLLGRLTVRTSLSGARTHGEVLGAPSTLNLSSASARSTRAKLLHELARAPQIDWLRLLEELAIRIFEHQDQGDPATNLATLPTLADDTDDTFSYHGISLPARHQSMLFGDGGVMKSFLMLAIAVYLVRSGLRVVIFDWELHARDHWRRLRMMCGEDLPAIAHVRCMRPLVHESERLRRLVRAEGIDYAFYDSAGFATQGAPESAEAALSYFQATSLIGIGGLHLAHVTKGGDQNDLRPFGSNFWHHSARCTWNIKLESDASGERGRQKTLGLFNRKANLDDLYAAVGLAVNFNGGRVAFAPTDLSQTAELVTSLSLRERMYTLVKGGPRTITGLADELDAKPDTLDRLVRRHRTLFAKVDGRIALVERRPM